MTLKVKRQDAHAKVMYYAMSVGRARTPYTKEGAIDNLVAAVKEYDRLCRIKKDTP